MKRLTLIAIAVIVATLSSCSPAQTVQTTWQQLAYSAAHATGPSVIFRNVNQSSHWLAYCVTGGPTALSIQLEESANGTSGWVPISRIGSINSGCDVVQAGGYWFAVRANITVLTGGLSPTVTAIYTASTGTIGLSQNIGIGAESQIVTYDSISSPPTGDLAGAVVQVKSAGTQLQTASSTYVLYGATIYNPNAGTVYVGFSGAAGTVPSSAAVMMAVPAGQSLVLNLPVQGVALFGVAVNCSTSLSANADPASSCVVNPFIKAAFTGAPYNGVPN